MKTLYFIGFSVLDLLSHFAAEIPEELRKVKKIGDRGKKVKKKMWKRIRKTRTSNTELYFKSNFHFFFLVFFYIISI